MSVLATKKICLVSTADICPVSAADICPVSTEDIYPFSTEDGTAAGRRPAAVMFIDFVCIYYTLATFRGAENHHFLMFFGNPVLAWFLEHILTILAHFCGPFWKPFSSLFGYHFRIIF